MYRIFFLNQDFGETEDFETRYAIARQLFQPEVPMEIDECDQQQPQANIAENKTPTANRRRIRTSFPIPITAAPIRRLKKPFQMIPENWEPVSMDSRKSNFCYSHILLVK